MVYHRYRCTRPRALPKAQLTTGLFVNDPSAHPENQIDPMYQYALPWFSALFCKTIGQTPPAPELEGRLKNLNDCFTAAVYANVCRSLFEAHKLLFSFLLAIKILQASAHVLSRKNPV